MNECLVTKLKTVVNDDSLEKLGYAKVSAVIPEGLSNDHSFVQVGFSKPSNVIVEKGSVKNANVPSNNGIYNSNTVAFNAEPGEFVIFIDKYNIQSIGPLLGNTENTLNIKDLEYSKLNAIRLIRGLYGDIAYLKNSDLVTVSLGCITDDSALYGDVSIFGRMARLEYLHLDRRTAIYGDIASLGSCTHLEFFQGGGSKIKGSLESLVISQRNNGRTSGSINMPWAGACKGLTFNGTSIINKETNTLSWTASTITFNDVTINI